MLSFLSLFALIQAARAGTYSVASYTVTPGSGNVATYTPSTYDCKGAGSGSAFTSYSGGPQTFSATANGKITATFTWQPTNGDSVADPPPSCAIVQQVSSAGWSGGYQGDAPPPTGDCDPGLPNATYTTGTLSKSGSATYYFLKSQPGSSFTADCTPTASSSGSSGSPGSGSHSSVNVSYSACAAPVILFPSGPTKDFKLLTGQQVSAVLTIPHPYSANNITYTVDSATYKWSAAGDTFYTYHDQATSHPLVLLSDDPSYTTSPTFTFYDKTAESVTVTCNATIVCPDGTRLPVTAQSQPISVLKPTAVWTVSSTAPLGPQFDQTMMGFYVQWSASITVPSPFSGGSGCFAQVVAPTIQFQRHPSGNQPINCYLKEPHRNADGTTTYLLPTTGLDNQFPYPFDLTQTYSNGYIWDVSGIGQSGDAPAVSLSIQASDNGGNNWYTAYDSGVFTTWLMYKPSLSMTGSPNWIPLQRVDWSWTGNVVKNIATGMWGSANSGAPVTGSSPDHGVPTPIPPQWNTVNVGAATLQP